MSINKDDQTLLNAISTYLESNREQETELSNKIKLLKDQPILDNEQIHSNLKELVKDKLDLIDINAQISKLLNSKCPTMEEIKKIVYNTRPEWVDITGEEREKINMHEIECWVYIEFGKVNDKYEGGSFSAKLDSERPIGWDEDKSTAKNWVVASRYLPILGEHVEYIHDGKMQLTTKSGLTIEILKMHLEYKK